MGFSIMCFPIETGYQPSLVDVLLVFFLWVFLAGNQLMKMDEHIPKVVVGRYFLCALALRGFNCD